MSKEGLALLEEDLFKINLDHYLHFCRSPRRAREAVREEFLHFIRHPFLQGVGFCGNSTILIGTQPVYIYDDSSDTTHHIGEFLITISRRQEGIYWHICIDFENINNMHLPEKNFAFHPHISSRGELCIQGGRSALFQSIRFGHMYDCLCWLEAILHTYNIAGNPFSLAENWPMVPNSFATKHRKVSDHNGD